MDLVVVSTDVVHAAAEEADGSRSPVMLVTVHGHTVPGRECASVGLVLDAAGVHALRAQLGGLLASLS